MAKYTLGKTSDTFTHRYGYAPNTLSVTSSRNRVLAYNSEGEYQQIGVMSTFDPSESRNIEQVRAIGYGDKIAELVPGATEAMTISVTRTAQYLQNIFQAFGYKGGMSGLVRSLRHHRWPFDIAQELVLSEVLQESDANTSFGLQNASAAELTADEESRFNESFEFGGQNETYRALVTRYVGCWFSSWSTSFAADQALVNENCEIMVTDIYDKEANDQDVMDDVAVKAGIYTPSDDGYSHVNSKVVKEETGVSGIGLYSSDEGAP